MKKKESKIDAMQPLLCEEYPATWQEYYVFIARTYSYKISVQNHPAAESMDRLSCIGITIDIKDCKELKKIDIRKYPHKMGGADYNKEEKRILVHYEHGDINNIIQDLKANRPLTIVYGLFTNDSIFAGKKYVAIENYGDIIKRY